MPAVRRTSSFSKLSFASSLLEAEFDSTVRDGGGNVIGGIADGNRLASVPKIQLAATGTYSFPINLGSGSSEGFVSASIQHIGDHRVGWIGLSTRLIQNSETN